jgi:4-hydroxybenzoate polyprenyltransferase
VGVLLAASYPFMKRYTQLPQVYLGAAFGWAIIMAFAAQAGELTRVAWLLFIANVIWATVYDTQYGMVDREDDLKIGVKSTAILFGRARSCPPSVPRPTDGRPAVRRAPDRRPGHR